MSSYSLYILRCADDTYYTGIARDVDARLLQHEGGTRGAKYLRGRAPFELVYRCDAGDRGAAQRLEHRVKALDRDAKQALIDGRLSVSELQASGSASGSA
ncbi:MAG: GIY-YIG nuclease family protein, partial [Woeseiaceae bacterium]|nr:GIY-YIG nuclease family protein [Woeseiaceae bacterium]